MKESAWEKNMVELLEWVELQPASDIIKAIQLSIQLGNTCNDDELRNTYWTAICSLGYRNNIRDGGLRWGFENKLSGLSCKIRGRVIYRNGSPSLEDLTVTAILCDNEKGRQKETKIRQICASYNLRDKNISISYKDCSPKKRGRTSRYERTGRSGAYHGTNRWEPGN